MTTRKFYRTIIQVEILSEDPVGELATALSSVAREITDGDWSGQVYVVKQDEQVSPALMAQLLINQGSDPSFFRLNESGEDDS